MQYSDYFPSDIRLGCRFPFQVFVPPTVPIPLLSFIVGKYDIRSRESDETEMQHRLDVLLSDKDARFATITTEVKEYIKLGEGPLTYIDVFFICIVYR